MIAPSTLSSSGLEMVATAAATLIHQNSSNVGAMLLPFFTYKKGGLRQLESQLTQRIVGKGLSVDRGFSAPFKTKPDPREASSQGGSLSVLPHRSVSFLSRSFTGMTCQVRPLELRGRFLESPMALFQVSMEAVKAWWRIHRGGRDAAFPRHGLH